MDGAWVGKFMFHALQSLTQREPFGGGSIHEVFQVFAEYDREMERQRKGFPSP